MKGKKFGRSNLMAPPIIEAQKAHNLKGPTTDHELCPLMAVASFPTSQTLIQTPPACG
jgi:hypothetical protein